MLFPWPNSRDTSYVTEYNPLTERVRGWYECHDHLGNINRVHPKNVNGQIISSPHYPPTGAELVKGIMLGRFQIDSKITLDLLKKIINSKKELKKMPIVAQADFGHTLPIFTFPIGGEARLQSTSSGIKLVLLKK